MARSVFQQLATIGKQLAHPPHTKDSILKLLKQAADLLSEMKQSQEVVGPLQPLTRALVLPMLLNHRDKDVRLLTTSCIMEILRIVAPDAPYNDKELQEIFRLVVAAFAGLNETSSSSFPRRTAILEIMANLRICVVMLDVGCDDLILEMFQTFFSVVSDKHPASVLTAMQTAMVAVLQESGNIPIQLLDLILKNLLKHNKVVSSAAHKLAVGVVQQSAEKLEPYLQRLLTSVMVEGKAAEIDLHADYHDIIHEIYQWAPQMLLAVIPNLTQELVNDSVDVRMKAVKLLGRLFALPGQHVAKEYRQLFSEFLKRFTDKAVEVRLAMVECAKNCLKSNPTGSEASEILAGLNDRILDNEEVIRLHSVTTICDVAKSNFKWVPSTLLTHVAERLRDKKILVRKEAFQKLADVYRSYCAKCYEGFSTFDKQLEWIPGKLIRCCYDKDVKEFRPSGIEMLLSENLFPRQLSVVERAKHWIAVYSTFAEHEKKALARVLSQKKRLQEDMFRYLSLREKEKEISSKDPRIERLFKSMSLSFVDTNKAEENLKKFHSMKDKKIFKALVELLNPVTTFSRSEEIIDELSKRVGENHPQHDLLKMLASRCSFRMFGKEHAKVVIEEVTANQELAKEMVAAGLSLLADFLGFFPFLIQDAREGLVALLLKGDETAKERVADILARAGSAIRGHLQDANSSTELTLQTLCLEGTRKQAKYSVSALAALSVDEGFKSLSVLYGRLIERLKEENPHLPTVLQSLACIAQRAVPIFETQEDDIVRFVVRRLLQKSHVGEAAKQSGGGWESPSQLCSLQIYGLKMLVKSFLPHKDHARKRLRGLIGLLSKLLLNGCVSESSGASENDKAHLRLASAKGVLRLARRWDAHLPVQLFHSCVYTAQDTYLDVRQQFLKKLHRYLRDHTLSHKYASAYAFFALESSKEVIASVKHNLADFVGGCRREARVQQNSSSGVPTETAQITHSPEYVLTYLVHAIAHHSSFPSPNNTSADGYEPFYRVLLLFLKGLTLQDNDSLGKEADNLPAIVAILRTIKKAEDALEESKTDHLHVVCELGIVITKELGRSSLHSETYPGPIPLPSSFYSVKTTGEDDTNGLDGSHLPNCLDSDVLSQFWSRASKPGQIQPLSSSHQPKREVEIPPETTSRENLSTHTEDPTTSSEEHVRPRTRSRKGAFVSEVEIQPLSSTRKQKRHAKSLSENGSRENIPSPHEALVLSDEEVKRPQTRSRKAVIVSNAQMVLDVEIAPGLSNMSSKAAGKDGQQVTHKRKGSANAGLDSAQKQALVKDKASEKVMEKPEGSSHKVGEKKTSPRKLKALVKVKAGERAIDTPEGSCKMGESRTSPRKRALVKDQAVEGRVLRNRDKLQNGNHQVAVALAAGSDDDSEQETLTTWRTRRRRVQ